MEEEKNEDDPGGSRSGPAGSTASSRKTSSSAIALIMEVTTAKTKEKFSSRQWILLIFFGVIDFLSAMTISMQAPFYPEEAERKGAKAAEYGLVFGIFEFVVFIMAPVFGKYMNKIGPRALFSGSILLNSLAVIFFGFLHWVDDHTWFITLSFICRIVEGLGCAGFFTSTFVMISCEFPKSVATTFASLETCIGLGLIFGPTVGGALNTLGGFPLPFFAIGACTLTTGVSALCFMPKTDTSTTPDGLEAEGYGIFTILKIPSVALAALSIVSTSMSYGFIGATLEPHIRQFGLTPLQTGFVFVANGGIYAVTAPMWGYLCDKIKRPCFINIVGNFLICASFVLIGPAEFVPLDTILWVTIVGLLIQGLGFGCCFVSSFVIGLQDSMKNGLPDNLATYAVCSGMWQAMISLGAFIGPSAGGFLFDTVGFREGSWLILITSFVAGMTTIMYGCLTYSSSTGGESEPLLRSKEKPALVTRKSALEESGAVQPFSSSPSSSSYGSTTHTGAFTVEHDHAN